LVFKEEMVDFEENSKVAHALEYTCLCGPTDYDNQSFRGFLSRRGWSILPGSPIQLVRLDGSKPQLKDVEPFVQTWLFFGALTEVFGISGIEFAAEDFARLKDSDEHIITMILFDRYLEDWAMREAKADRAQYPHKHGLAMDCLNLVMHLVGDDGNGIPEASIHPEIRDLIQITTRSLKQAADIIWRDSGPTVKLEDTVKRILETRFMIPRTIFPFDHAEVGWSTSLAMMRSYPDMLKDGWCPADVKALGPLMLFSGWHTYFASTLSRPSMGSVDHSSCSEHRCVLRTVDDLTYESRHVVQGHSCEHTGPEIKHVVSILRDGGTPRLIVHKDAAMGIRLTVRSDGPYVAISHVWSDGLGNARDNTLPTCQLQRLRDLVESLVAKDCVCNSPVAIWIDTLCVPLERQSRKLALQTLEKVYEEAEYVLVLDAELQRLMSSRCSQEEIYTRVYMCGWMRRLWTLEEGVVGRENLRIQFFDTTITLPSEAQMTEIVDTRQGVILTGIVEHLYANLPQRPTLHQTLRGPQLSGTRLSEPEHLNALAPILTSVQNRSTTKAEDETLCIASVFRLPKGTIIALNTAPERMKAFLQILSDLRLRVSTDILFYPEPKLRLDGYRWAPASLMTISKDVDRNLHKHPLLRDYITNEGSYFDDCGLQCEITGYELGLIDERGLVDISVVSADTEGGRPGIWRAVNEQNIGIDAELLSNEQGRILYLIFDGEYDESTEFGLAVSIYHDERTTSNSHEFTAGRVYARYLFRIARRKDLLVPYLDSRELLYLDLQMAEKIEGVTWCIG
jgi:hypothetical protein